MGHWQPGYPRNTTTTTRPPDTTSESRTLLPSGVDSAKSRAFAATLCGSAAPSAIPAVQLGDHSYFAYLLVDDIDSLHKSVCEAGVQICKPLRDEPWQMREFGLVTTDGHRIMFGAHLAR